MLQNYVKIRKRQRKKEKNSKNLLGGVIDRGIDGYGANPGDLSWEGLREIGERLSMTAPLLKILWQGLPLLTLCLRMSGRAQRRGCMSGGCVSLCGGD